MDSVPFEQEPKVGEWKRAVTGAGCRIHRMEPLALVPRRNGELLFGLFEVGVTDPEGRSLPHVLFLRGASCIVVALLINTQTTDERFLMVEQRRVGNGRMSLEFPAGMLDREVHDPRGAAARELLEETGLTVDPAALSPLASEMLYSTPGASDEAIFFYGCIVRLEDAPFRSFEGQRAGDHADHEYIHVRLKTRLQAQREATSCQVRLGICLFDEWRAGTAPR